MNTTHNPVLRSDARDSPETAGFCQPEKEETTHD